MEETVGLQQGKQLQKIGWKKWQTKVYHKTSSNKRSCDLPNKTELKKMCEEINYVIEEELPVSMLAEKLIDYCRRHKISLSNTYINQ